MATFPTSSVTQERPTSVHAEMTILGAMLVEPVAIIDATMLLKTDDFALDSHRKIYAAMLHLVEVGHGSISLRSCSSEQKKGAGFSWRLAVSGFSKRRIAPQTQY